MGILAFQGRDVAIERWTETFQNYLNVAAVPCLSSKGIQNSSFEMVPVGWLEDPMAMLRARLLDFYFTQAGQFVCFSLEIPLEPVVTLKNLRAGEEVEVYGGLVVTAANRSDMNQFNDLRHKIISAVNPSGLGGFQMQWAHIEEASQIMLIRDAKMLQFTGSQIKSLQDVKSGMSLEGVLKLSKNEWQRNATLNIQGSIHLPLIY
ncbi:hypothetical protein BSKO_13100 [Bryopsis sp. KO-2023]|nr:hypothetical protein BSKO_13100 [Bryopsis sp. KO-2023]